jgi:hypothetical protein
MVECVSCTAVARPTKRASCANALGRGTGSASIGAGWVDIGIDAIPARGDAPLDPDDIRGRLGPELLDAQ